MITVTNLTKVYGVGDKAVAAVQDVSLHVPLRRHLRHPRPQRCRQDDADALPDRPRATDVGFGDGG